MDSEPTSTPIPVIFENFESEKNGKEHLHEVIDSIEQQVESLRIHAAMLEDERDGIATALETIRHSTFVDVLIENDKEEILINLDRLTSRVGSVEISVRTCRDSLQEEALFEVNDLINRMVVNIESDKATAKQQCHGFINACLSDSEGGHIDKKFENALLGCALDDQKRIRRRLYGLMNYLERMAVSML